MNKKLSSDGEGAKRAYFNLMADEIGLSRTLA
jgi:hypothetical protein